MILILQPAMSTNFMQNWREHCIIIGFLFFVCLKDYASQSWWTTAAPLWCPTTAVPPSKQLKHHGPGQRLNLPTKQMQGQRATTVLARRLIMVIVWMWDDKVSSTFSLIVLHYYNLILANNLQWGLYQKLYWGHNKPHLLPILCPVSQSTYLRLHTHQTSRVESSESFDFSQIDSFPFTLKESRKVTFISNQSDAQEWSMDTLSLVVLHVLLWIHRSSPFSNIDVMLAISHSLGTWRVLNKLLKIIHSWSSNICAASTNTLGWTPSGPEDLFLLNFFSDFNISSFNM